MTDDETPEPNLQRIVEDLAPAVPLRAEVEDAIERYVTARRGAAIADERSAGMYEGNATRDRGSRPD